MVSSLHRTELKKMASSMASVNQSTFKRIIRSSSSHIPKSIAHSSVGFVFPPHRRPVINHLRLRANDFKTRAVPSDDEWGPDPGETPPLLPDPDDASSSPPLLPPPPGGAVGEEAKGDEETSKINLLKKQLIDSFYGTNRGLSASSESRAEITELIQQLEAKNPNPAPTEALSLLNGKWILAYTTFSGLLPLFSRGGGLPLPKVEQISQTIDAENFTVQNSVVFASSPLATTSVTTNAKFEVRSPKRLQIKFEEGIIGTPQLTDSSEPPENVEFLGRKIDLSPFRGVLSSVKDAAASVVRTFSSGPPLKFPIPNRKAESWLLTTYLDDELRISRGDGGSVFVLVKAGSTLLLLS